MSQNTNSMSGLNLTLIHFFAFSKLSATIWLTGIFALDCPGGAVTWQGGGGCQRPVRRSGGLHIRLHCGVQWRFGVVRKRSQAIGREAVPQGVSQLEPTEPI